jgi:hypothetical protein
MKLFIILTIAVLMGCTTLKPKNKNNSVEPRPSIVEIGR